jgi:hypothetical protein
VVNCRHHVVSVRPPFSVANGFDRNIDAIAGDRPDISNPARAPGQPRRPDPSFRLAVLRNWVP